KQERWKAFGGFVGVLLPYHHFVDFEGSIGAAARVYSNPDTIYGPNGLSKTLPALTLPLGVSDRMSPKPVALRLGGALAFGFELSHQDAPWRKEYTDASGQVSATNGTTPIGGVSIALVVSIGLEAGGRPRYR